MFIQLISFKVMIIIIILVSLKEVHVGVVEKQGIYLTLYILHVRQRG